MPKIRIYNITSFLHSPGIGLDFEKKYIPPNPNKPLVIDLPVIPQLLEEWAAKKWVKWVDADDKTPVTKETETVITPGPLSEAKASEVDALDELDDGDIVDFSIAKEAALPGDAGVEKSGPVPLQPINQTHVEEPSKGRAKVSLGSEDKMNMAETVSPIPGDRPRSIDNSDAFTVRAPRHNGPGAVVKGS